MQATFSPQRDSRIDVYRGLALVFILWDHIPNNILGLVTLRAFGLSDSAEVFVYLSGFSAAMAYSTAFYRHGYLYALVKILRRVAHLYIAHIFVFALLVGIVFVMNSQVETRDYISEMGLGMLIHDTERAFIAELTLRFKPSLMDPLPLYMALLALLAVALPFLIRFPVLAVLVSASVYGVAQVWNINLQAWPSGVWFFNPWSWQFLFILGAIAALRRLGPHHAWLVERPRLQTFVFRAALGYVALCFVLVLLWHTPTLHDRLIPHAVGSVIYPISKTNLAPLRLLHFIALAYCLAAVLPQGAWVLSPIAKACQMMGRHSLVIFCLGILLAPMADGVNALFDDTPLVQCLSSLCACGVMVACAWALDWANAMQRQGALKAAPEALGSVR